MLEHLLTKLYPPRQVTQWVYEYLQAPISLREIVEDTGSAGASHRPALLHTRPSVAGGETRFRRCVGLEIAEQVARYLLLASASSNFLHPASPASCILHPASCILHPVFTTYYLATYPRYLTTAAEQAARYNRYFDAHGVDLLLIPAARSPYAAQGSNPALAEPRQVSYSHV